MVEKKEVKKVISAKAKNTKADIPAVEVVKKKLVKDTDLSTLKEVVKEKEVKSVNAIQKQKEVKDSLGRVYSTGKRKTSVARVWIKLGKGRIVVNGKEHEQYFRRPILQMIINQPFELVNRIGSYDVEATVKGGGLSGQAGALKHGISKALSLFEPELRSVIKKAGFLTRDSRIVERKHYGHKKARRSFQFSKR